MGDVDDWNADMDAWHLLGTQRTHHLWRLHSYHRAVLELRWRRYDRLKRVEGWFALAAFLAVVVGLLAVI